MIGSSYENQGLLDTVRKRTENIQSRSLLGQLLLPNPVRA
jgi:hypothetical protein